MVADAAYCLIVFLLTACESEDIVTSADNLLLDAKQAILDEQHRRFQVLYGEGRRQEALRQIQLTIACAKDLLSESLRVLEEALERGDHASGPTEAPTSR